MKDYLLGAENTVMKKLKIAVDARTLGSRPSGVGMYLNDFLEQLITYDEFEWILFTDVEPEPENCYCRSDTCKFSYGRRKQSQRSAGIGEKDQGQVPLLLPHQWL